MVYVFLAEGFEEIEAITVVDLLRRADIQVQTVGVGLKQVKGAHNIFVECDILDHEVQPNIMQMLVLPGGMPGTVHLAMSHAVVDRLKYAVEHGVWVAAICAAPSILGNLGLLEGKKATCFPGFENAMHKACLTGELVEEDGIFITGKGPGASILFALRLIEKLKGKQTAQTIEEGLQCKKS